ncbi:MAG: sugar hydrolase [Calditrichaeota bacterium]|nr:sugar hydrolase [Calditrichota bacterium]
MGFGEQQKQWLAIAESLKPALFREIKYPKFVVEPVADADAFQNWQMKNVQPVADLLKLSFAEGDHFVLDFGEHIVGYLQSSLSLDGAAMGGPLRLKLTFCEVPSEIAEPFDPYSGSLSRAWLQDEIITVDELPQTVRLSRRFAFRFLKIEVLACSFDYRFRFGDFRCETVTSAPPDIETYCDERIPESLREIDRVALRTLRNCFQTVPEDGPKRDRRLWLADSPLMAQVMYQTFQNYDIYKRVLHLFAGLAHDDGRIPACVYEQPQPHISTEFISDFAIMYGAYLLDYAENSNDWETAERLWPVAKKQLDVALAYLDENGLFHDHGKYWVFIDWQPELDKQAAMQGLFIHAFKQIMALATVISRENEVAKLPEIIEKMTAAAMQLRSEDAPYFFLSGDSRQLSWASQIWMILAEVVDAPTGAKLLRETIKSPDAVKPATPFIYHYTAEAMFKCGLQTEAISLIQSYWGKMVELGASTFWEIFDPEDHWKSPYGSHHVNSYCHSWSCTPAYLIRKYVVK